MSAKIEIPLHLDKVEFLGKNYKERRISEVQKNSIPETTKILVSVAQFIFFKIKNIVLSWSFFLNRVIDFKRIIIY